MAGPTKTLLGRRSLIGGALESTPGTPESVSTALAGIFYGGAITPVDWHGDGERAPDGVAGMGTSTYQRGPTLGQATFMLEVRNGDALGTLAQACGLKQTTGPVWTRTSDITEQQTITLVQWLDGIKRTLYGAMGTFTLSPSGPGRRLMAEFTFQGIFDEVVDAAMPSAPSVSGSLYLARGMTVEVASSAIPYIGSFTLDLGNTVVQREDLTAAEAVRHFMIEDHRQRLTLDPESRLVASQDEYGLLRADTEQSVQIVLEDNPGASGANSLTIDAGQAQRINVSDGDRGQKRVFEIELALNEGSSDSLAITES